VVNATVNSRGPQEFARVTQVHLREIEVDSLALLPRKTKIMEVFLAVWEVIPPDHLCVVG